MNILYERKVISIKICSPDFMNYDRWKPFPVNQ